MAAQPVGTQVVLDDLTVRDLTLDDPDPDTLVCGQTATLTAHLWDAEGYQLPTETVEFAVTNGEFNDTHTASTTRQPGENGYMTVAVTPTTGDPMTVTAEYRDASVQKTIAVKRDKLSMMSTPRLDDPSGTATVYATLTANGQPVIGATIVFTAVSGGSVSPAADTTDSQGVAETTFTASGAGAPVVTAYVENACGWETTVTLGKAVDIVFVVDGSASMRGSPVHMPTPSIQVLLQDLSTAGVQFRAGAVVFSDTSLPLQVRSLSAYTNVTSFCSWLATWDHQDGSDETTLVGMDEAIDDVLGNTAVGTRPFIAVVTDETYSDAYQGTVSRAGLVERLHELTDPLGGVYLSVWEQYGPPSTATRDFYAQPPSLSVNGGFDSYQYIAAPAQDQYPFDKLRLTILQGILAQP